MPVELAEACAHAVMKRDQSCRFLLYAGGPRVRPPLEFLLGGLDKVPVLPVFINGVATPLPGFQRTRMLGEAIGRFTSTLNKRVLFLGSGGLSPSAAGARTGESRCPYARPSVGERERLTRQ